MRDDCETARSIMTTCGVEEWSLLTFTIGATDRPIAAARLAPATARTATATEEKI